jgi:hypothetical protein
MWTNLVIRQLESWEYDCGDPSCWPCGTLYLQGLAQTSLTRGGFSIGIIRSRTQARELVSLPGWPHKNITLFKRKYQNDSWRGILSYMRAQLLDEVNSKIICWLQFVHFCYTGKSNQKGHKKACNSNHKQSCKDINQSTTCLASDTAETHHHSWSCHWWICWCHYLSVQIQCRWWLGIRQTKIWCPTLKAYIKVPQKYSSNIEKSKSQWQ